MRVPLPGVGANLQDRYEVSVVSRMNMTTWDCYEGRDLPARRPAVSRVGARRKGVYTTNGAVLRLHAIDAERAAAGSVLYSACSRTSRYSPATRRGFARDPTTLTWVVLKAHTKNRPAR